MSWEKCFTMLLVVMLSASTVSAALVFSDDMEGYGLGLLSDPGTMAIVASTDGNGEWQDFGGAKPNVISNARNHTGGGGQSLLQELGYDGGYGSDLIFRLNNTITSGQVTFTVWQFMEGDADFDGKADFYISQGSIDTAGNGFDEGSYVEYNGATNQVNPSGAALVKNRWVELKWEVDLDNDTQVVSYDGAQIINGAWDVNASGAGDFSSMNFWVTEGSTSNSRVYYDDFSVDAVPEPASLVMFLSAALAGLGLLRRR